MSDLTQMLAKFPRAELLSGPTPLTPLDRMSEQLGINLWIKRDDLTGLGFGGNKIRQLEFYFGAALAKNADTILITGAVQSNYVRCAAAAAAKLGLNAILQLEERVPGKGETYRTSGNVLLSQLLGAQHINYAQGEDESGADLALQDQARQLRGQGHTPYVIPLGLNNPPLGALGYMLAAEEILAQGPEFDAIVVASGSGQTHMGLLTGLRALGASTPIYGICVRREAKAQTARLATVGKYLATLLETDYNLTDDDICTSDSALTPGYGQVGTKTRAAISKMAQTEGLFLDPVYTGKGFAGLLDLVQDGKIRPGSRVLFVHTGGQAALFAYQDEVTAS